MRSMRLLLLAGLLGCGGSTVEETAEPAPASSGGEPASERTAADPTVGPQAASPECRAYLDHYRRCEAQLHDEIMAGHRRFYRAEEGWILYLEQSAEGPSMPAGCRAMETELSEACP